MDNARRTSCHQCEQQAQGADSFSPLHAYFSTLMSSQQPLMEATLVQDNPATFSRSTQGKTFNIANTRQERFLRDSTQNSSLSSSDALSTPDDTALLMETDRWESETSLDSSEHSNGCDASSTGDRMRLSLDKPRLPKRRSSPIIMLDEPHLRQIFDSVDNLDAYEP